MYVDNDKKTEFISMTARQWKTLSGFVPIVELAPFGKLDGYFGYPIFDFPRPDALSVVSSTTYGSLQLQTFRVVNVPRINTSRDTSRAARSCKVSARTTNTAALRSNTIW